MSENVGKNRPLVDFGFKHGKNRKDDERLTSVSAR